MKKIVQFILLMSIICIADATYARKSDSLSARQVAIVNIASVTAVGNLVKLKPALNNALNEGLSINEIKEVFMHLYAYCGFPRSLRGIQTFMEVLNERKLNGINDKNGVEASPIKDKRSRYERGKDNLAKLRGVSQDGPPTGYAAFAPEIDTFLKEHLFADLFDRDVLNFADRELVTVSVNSSVGGVEPMVRSHMGLSLNTGITPTQLKQLVNLIEINVGIKEGTAAKEILKDVLKSRGLNTDDIDITAITENQIVSEPIFPKGEKTPAANFTGIAWAKRLVQEDATGTYSVGSVTFEPGARTNWHTHPAGQTLLVLEGKGGYQEKGKSARIIVKGDVVVIPANIPHWHGAANDCSFTHIAITGRKDGGVKWLQPVSDVEYNSTK